MPEMLARGVLDYGQVRPGDPLLFLDFDGVLNCTRWFVSQHERWKTGKIEGREWQFDPRCVANLNRVLFAVPPLRIVVSSSWRGNTPVSELARIVESVGVRPGRVIGKTGHAESRLRFEEILQWVEEHAPASRWAAVDDDSLDMKQLGERFFWTDRRFGLTRAVARRLTKHLRSEA